MFLYILTNNKIFNLIAKILTKRIFLLYGIELGVRFLKILIIAIQLIPIRQVSN